MMKQKWLLVACQVILAVSFMLMFFETAPWLGTRQLSELPTTNQSEAPVWAKSFSYDHGKVMFLEHGTISEEPVAFAIRVAGVLGLLILLLLSIWLPRKRGSSAPAATT
jgi:hypothetical protein